MTLPTDRSHTAATSRHVLVDAIRGFALWGILVVNIEFIVQPAECGWLHHDPTTDQVLRWLIIALGQTKVYPLFALLFGYGLSLQMSRARRDGAVLWPRYRRRMVGILLLGIVHGIVFFPGDILVIYAAIGAAAFWFRDTPTPRLMRIAGWVYATAALGWLCIGALEVLSAPPVVPSASAEALMILSTGSPREVVTLHFFYWLETLPLLSIVQGPAVLALFQVGIALGRSDVLITPDRHPSLRRRVLRWSPFGFVAAALGATLTVAGGRWETLGFALGFVASPFVAATYLVLLAQIVGRGTNGFSRLLAAAGRMSLTVYLLESVLASTIAYGYGFGRFGEAGPLEGILTASAIWLALATFSLVWMRHARFGPFEWLLRSFTYKHPQAFTQRGTADLPVDDRPTHPHPDHQQIGHRRELGDRQV